MERVHPNRRLTAVLLADVVGYSRLMSIDEEGTYARLGDCVDHLIEPTVSSYGGRLTRSRGDGFLVEFDSAVDAVRCAVQIQNGLADASADGNDSLELRIGINSGDVIFDEHDIYGNSVNIASRLEGLAEPGGIYITEAVREQLHGHPGLRFQPLGGRRVKNIERAIKVFRVVAEGTDNIRTSSRPKFLSRVFGGRPFFLNRPATVMSAGLVAVATVGSAIVGLPPWLDHSQFSSRASIMVLPFRNSSGDPGEDYIADAVTDDLTTDLSRLSDTLVISRATAFTYKGKRVDVREVGRKFDIRYMLEGSVGRIGDRVQATAELVDTSSAAAIWADRFDTDVTTLPDLYDAVTGRIATTLHRQLVRAEFRRRVGEQTANPHAIDLRLHAMSHLTENETPESSLAARKSLRESLVLDAQSAEAWSELGLVLVRDYVRNWNGATREDLDDAEAALKNALEIDPSNAIAFLARGEILRVKGDDQGSLDAFDQALLHNPNLALAAAQKANQLVFLGRAKEATSQIKKAIEISPSDPALGIFYWITGRAYFALKDYDTSIVWLRKSIELQPTVWFNRAHLISAYALTNQLEQPEAQAALAEYRQKFKNWPLSAIQGWFDKAQPNPQPGFKENLAELYKGLRLAEI